MQILKVPFVSLLSITETRLFYPSSGRLFSRTPQFSLADLLVCRTLSYFGGQTLICSSSKNTRNDSCQNHQSAYASHWQGCPSMCPPEGATSPIWDLCSCRDQSCQTQRTTNWVLDVPQVLTNSTICSREVQQAPSNTSFTPVAAHARLQLGGGTCTGRMNKR